MVGGIIRGKGGTHGGSKVGKLVRDSCTSVLTAVWTRATINVDEYTCTMVGQAKKRKIDVFKPAVQPVPTSRYQQQ